MPKSQRHNCTAHHRRGASGSSLMWQADHVRRLASLVPMAASVARAQARTTEYLHLREANEHVSKRFRRRCQRIAELESRCAVATALEMTQFVYARRCLSCRLDMTRTEKDRIHTKDCRKRSMEANERVERDCRCAGGAVTVTPMDLLRMATQQGGRGELKQLMTCRSGGEKRSTKGILRCMMDSEEPSAHRKNKEVDFTSRRRTLQARTLDNVSDLVETHWRK